MDAGRAGDGSRSRRGRRDPARNVRSTGEADAARAVTEKAARIVAAEVGRHTRGEPLAHCLNP